MCWQQGYHVNKLIGMTYREIPTVLITQAPYSISNNNFVLTNDKVFANQNL